MDLRKVVAVASQGAEEQAAAINPVVRDVSNREAGCVIANGQTRQKDSGDPEEHRQKPVHLQNLTILQAADHAADLLPPDRHRLVDLHL